MSETNYADLALRDLLLEIASNYDRTKGLATEAQDLLRQASWRVLGPLCDREKYIVDGSGGRGGASYVPYIAIFRRDETTSAKRGLYVVYLFKADMTEIYLSLNQGATDLVKRLGHARARRELRNRADTIRRKIADAVTNYLPTIDLGVESPLPRDYEAGNIAALRYSVAELPSDEQLKQDLEDILNLYDQALLARGPQPSDEESTVDGVEFFRKMFFPDNKFDIADLAVETFLSNEELEDLVDTLLNRRPQIILAGPPGTGKTWIAERLAEYLAAGNSNAVHIVQFHPTYSYEDFVEGLRPVGYEGQVAFETVEGLLVRAADQARVRVGDRIVLIIDEMNRANLPNVFGELLYLLEYRDKHISLLHRDTFSLPPNLYIIGTMNTADRSIRSVDTALRRRFDIFRCEPRPDILDAFYLRADNKSDVPALGDGLQRLNELLIEHLDPHHTIGHSFFMSKHFTYKELTRTWNRQIKPLIEEYFFDQPDLVSKFEIAQFWPVTLRP